MLNYIIEDILEVLQYLPYGLAAAVFVALLDLLRNRYRGKRGKRRLSPALGAALACYGVVLAYTVYFCRPPGSRSGVDLTLFGTLGGPQSNAYVVENVLLFIPFGVMVPMRFRWLRRFSDCVFMGMVCSIFIETIQYFTGRGFTQLDDVVMNTLGTICGYLIYYAFVCAGRTVRRLFGKERGAI